MRMFRLALFAAAVVGAACSRGGRKSGPVVAEGGGISVTAGEFKAKLEEQPPFIRARYTTIERKKELLDNLIRLELLAREAEKKGLDKDPEVQSTLKKIMVQKLVRQAFEEGESKASDAEVAKYYEDHRDEFVKPERLRLSLIWLDAPVGSPQRAAKLSEAKKTLARLKADEPKDPRAFGALARDLGSVTQDELTRQHSKELAAAAFALKDVGQESGVVETPQGFGIVKLMARQAPLDKSLEEVKPQLVARIGREKRAKEFDEYVKRLREKAGIKVNDAELEKIAVNVPAMPPGMPGMPGLPGMAGMPGAPAGPGTMPLQLQAAPQRVPPAAPAAPAPAPSVAK